MTNVICRCVVGVCSAMFCFILDGASYAQESAEISCRTAFEKATRSDESGPLAVYQLSDERVFLEIKKGDFEKEYIFANYVDRGVAPYVGHYAEPKLITFRLNGKRIDILEKDTTGFFEAEDPLSRTQPLTMSDAVVASLKLHQCKSADSHFAQIDKGVLTVLSSTFLNEIHHRGAAADAELKDWRTFSDNINFISEHRLSGGEQTNFSIRIRHILLQRPEPGFKSREMDPRVGYFTVSRRNLGVFDQSTSDSYIYRWRMEKKEPDEELSEPVKPIVFWIENTTPEKFRPYIRQGVLAWNEAFEAAGFLNAIEVYEQPVDADWEAGDISRNVIRWQVAYNARDNFGMAPAIHDPMTGEILGADILLNYSGIGDFMDDWSRLFGEAPFAETDTSDLSASHRGDLLMSSIENKISNTTPPVPATLAFDLEGAYVLASLYGKRRAANKNSIQVGVAEKISSASIDSEAPEPVSIYNAIASEPVEAPSAAVVAESGFTERMIEEVITQLTMHEVGHALGLAHNFRGSRLHSMDEIFNREKTNGVISSSVMDYLPINFAPSGVEQGDFANTRLGPYDVWAVEYGYRPDLSVAQKDDLLARASKPEYAFSARMFGGDPHTLIYDLTSAPVDYARSRLTLASEAAGLASSNAAFSDQNHYSSLFGELTLQTYLAINTIGAQLTPFLSGVVQTGANSSDLVLATKVHSKADQKDALKALEEMVFADGALSIPEEFVFRLGDDPLAAERLRVQAKLSVMLRLMSQQSLLLRDGASQYGGTYDATEFLFDMKRAVFGSDLSLVGNPPNDRREQQIMFASYLAMLINDPSSAYGQRRHARGFERSIVSAAARPVRDAILRELLVPTFWAPTEVRAHRRELRAILQ